MPCVCFVPKRFSAGSIEIIDRARAIMEDYAAQGYDLTLRQLYYRFVAGGYLPNTQQSYKRLGSVINDARLAGSLDWNMMVDRTRYIREKAHWGSPQEIIDACASQYRIDKWAAQPVRVECWIEKDALIGVVEQAAVRLDVPCLSCRGYLSQSEMWESSKRIRTHLRDGQGVVVLHLGDHDPSGLDMSRDNGERLAMFTGQTGLLRRIALTMDQVREVAAPPNPGKETDARFAGYRDLYGDESWELDALPPQYLDALITREVEALRDPEKWAEAVAEEEAQKDQLVRVSKQWDEIVDDLT